MKLNLPTVAKVYLLVVGLLNFHHGLSMLGLAETLVTAPPHLSVWWWHVLLFLGYGLMPLGAVFLNNEKICVVVTSVFIAGMFTESFGVFTMIVNGLILLSLDTLAAALSLMLAVEHTSMKVAAERLSLERSQF